MSSPEAQAVHAGESIGDAMIGSHESGETFNTLFAGGTPKPGWEARKYREFVRKNLTPIVGCTRQRFMPRLS